MMKNPFEDLSNEDLLKKRNMIKGIAIGLGIVALAAFGVQFFLLIEQGFKNVKFATFLSLFILPISFVPLLIMLRFLNKEAKSRNL